MLKKRIVALISAVLMFSASVANSSALSISSLDDNSNGETLSGDYYYEVDFQKLGVTTEELKELTYAEYYQKYFPEAWNTVFSEDEKELCKDLMFLEDRETKERASLNYVVSSEFGKNGLNYTGEANSVFVSGTKASNIKHESYIEDSTGHGVAGSISSTSTSTKIYTTTLSKRISTFTSGKSYRFHTLHTLKISGTTYYRNTYSRYYIPKS
ncbi:hypothetical protein [Terrisporobacter sp.]